MQAEDIEENSAVSVRSRYPLCLRLACAALVFQEGTGANRG